MDRCVLRHRLFAIMGAPMFRRSETDGTPVMVVLLGERTAAIPLRSLQREFQIEDASDDGRMLGLIAESLDYVAGLRIGDPLPQEVLSGNASWAPDQIHRQIADARLRLQLVRWLGAGADTPNLDAEALAQVADDPAMRQQVQDALARAAEMLGLADAEQVVTLIEELAYELAFIEALRDRLLRRVKMMVEKLERLTRAFRGDSSHMETLTQVQRLSGVALRQISVRFDEMDAQTGEVLAVLRNADSQRAFIRSNRDWLYRAQRAWEPILSAWDQADGTIDDGLFALLARSYRFLAPRFMPVTEWISATKPKLRTKDKQPARMIW
jgi:hypothetical protein